MKRWWISPVSFRVRFSAAGAGGGFRRCRGARFCECAHGNSSSGEGYLELLQGAMLRSVDVEVET
jgi:hypothetical protein